MESEEGEERFLPVVEMTGEGSEKADPSLRSG